MAAFVTVYDKSTLADDGFVPHHDQIIDWGEYKNVQQAANLSKEFLGKWTLSHPIKMQHLDRSTSQGSLWHVVDYAKNNLDHLNPHSGQWKVTPKFVPAYKGFVFLGNYQHGVFYHMSDSDFENHLKVKKNSVLGRKQLERVPYLWEESVKQFGKNKLKDKAIEFIIRFMGPTPMFDVRENSLRLFGGKNNGAFSAPADPKSFWTMYIYEMQADGKLSLEKRDFWQEVQNFYGTNSIVKMVAQNGWTAQKNFLGDYDGN